MIPHTHQQASLDEVRVVPPAGSGLPFTFRLEYLGLSSDTPWSIVLTSKLPTPRVMSATMTIPGFPVVHSRGFDGPFPILHYLRSARAQHRR